jgi:MFS family permease
MALLAGALAVLALAGEVRPWHVYVVALLLGTVSVVDNPTRQAFVVELVGPEQLRNALSINSSVFQLGAFIGPAVAGLTINAFGTGSAFALNAASYLGPIVALAFMRESELREVSRRSVTDHSGGVTLWQVVRRPEVFWPLVLITSRGMFGPNLPVTLAALTRDTFHQGAGFYGLLNAVVAIGSLLGALYSARQQTSGLRRLLVHGATASLAYLVAAAAPDSISMSIALFCVGGTTLLLLTGANTMVQLASPREFQGRVVGLYLLLAFGGAAIGGPALGFIDQHLGARLGLLLAGVLPAAAVGVAAIAVVHRPADDVALTVPHCRRQPRRIRWTGPSRRAAHLRP